MWLSKWVKRVVYVEGTAHFFVVRKAPGCVHSILVMVACEAIASGREHVVRYWCE